MVVTREKRIAVTLPAGPRLADTIELIRWAEDNGITDGWFADAGATSGLAPNGPAGRWADPRRGDGR